MEIVAAYGNYGDYGDYGDCGSLGSGATYRLWDCCIKWHRKVGKKLFDKFACGGATRI